MRKFQLFIVLGAGILLPVAAFADRPPTIQERASAERVLRANGFVAWDDIEFDDDGRWEVEDARLPNGARYDLKLAPRTFRIIRRVRDD